MQNNGESPKLPRLDGRSLTNRERECLKLVAPQFGSKEIARKLGISPNTVDARIKSACAKLGTNSRFVAARMVADEVTVNRRGTNLVSKSQGLPEQPNIGMIGASAGEGDSPGEIAPEGSLGLGSDDSGLGSGRRKFGNLIANFGGWQKNLSVARQLFHIVCIAIAGLIAFGVLVDGLTGLSKMLSLP